MKKKMEKQVFEITVWFRYSIAGEVEKDLECHKILATTVQEAVNKANNLYKSLKAIPFAFYHEKIKYKPTNMTMANMFNLTNPI